MKNPIAASLVRIGVARVAIPRSGDLKTGRRFGLHRWTGTDDFVLLETSEAREVSASRAGEAKSAITLSGISTPWIGVSGAGVLGEWWSEPLKALVVIGLELTRCRIGAYRETVADSVEQQIADILGFAAFCEGEGKRDALFVQDVTLAVSDVVEGSASGGGAERKGVWSTQQFGTYLKPGGPSIPQLASQLSHLFRVEIIWPGEAACSGNQRKHQREERVSQVFHVWIFHIVYLPGQV